MEFSQENQYVIECFKKNFDEKKMKRVAIYGIGNNTKALISALPLRNVVGLMDSLSEGKIVMGYPILSKEEVLKKADCIVIVARNSVVPIIFDRIKDLEEEYSFPIYNIQGERLINKKRMAYRNDSEYWDKTEEELMCVIEKHQVISFDIFDTLVMRTCMLPTDIFEMLEIRLKDLGIASDNFSAIRREIEEELGDIYPTLDNIYAGIQKKMQWSEHDSEIAQNCEISLEKEHCIPRKTMINIFDKAKLLGKRVILTSDMYLPQKTIEEILEQCGVGGYEKIYLSCVQKSDKTSGELFLKIKSDGYADILHIGDNALADGQSAVSKGIDSYLIWSAYEMLLQSSLGPMLAYVDNLEKRKCIGLLLSYLFDNPFSLGKTRGVVSIDKAEDLGYIFIGPLVRCFMEFLRTTVKKDKYDKILFCARDGYLIWKIYNKFFFEGSEGIYFLTSRRAITVASIESEADMIDILKKPYNTTMGELLLQRFGIVHDDDDKEAKLCADCNINPVQVQQYILKYKKHIMENAKKEHESYKKYIKSCNLEGAREIAMYDFCSSGTIKYYLHRFLDAEIKGVFFATVNIPNNLIADDSEIDSLYGNFGQYESQFNLSRYYILLEAILTESHGTLICFDKEGKPIYDEAENVCRDYGIIEDIQNGIEKYCRETSKKNWYVNMESMSKYADGMLGCLFEEEMCHISGNIKKVVKTENKYECLRAYPAWGRE